MSAAQRPGLRGALGAAYRYFVEEWPSVFFASAAVTVLMHTTSFVNAIDGYAWLVIGNLSSELRPDLPRPPEAVVVQVDEDANASRYLDRTPLDRCQLERDLRLVYGAAPAVVTVDLDLSPAHWLAGRDDAATAGERACQERLYELIRSEACKGRRTVLMVPFRQADEQALKRKVRCEDAREVVQFGDPSLPEQYGLLMSHYTGGDILARLALDAYRPDRRPHEGEPPPELDRIDTRRYPVGNGLELMSADALPL